MSRKVMNHKHIGKTCLLKIAEKPLIKLNIPFSPQIYYSIVSMCIILMQNNYIYFYTKTKTYSVKKLQPLFNDFCTCMYIKKKTLCNHL